MQEKVWIIFILGSNFLSLNCKVVANMVSKPHLVGGQVYEPHNSILENLVVQKYYYIWILKWNMEQKWVVYKQKLILQAKGLVCEFWNGTLLSAGGVKI